MAVTIAYYFRCLYKAFDGIEYVRLFHTLSDRNMSPTVLRLLMNMYINQS